MIRVAYFSTATGAVSRISAGPDLGSMSEPSQGELAALTTFSGDLPAYWDGQAVRPVPERPSSGHIWQWAPVFAWVPDLTASRASAWLAVKRERDKREFGAFEHAGMMFDGDEASQRRINLAVLGAQAALAAGQAWSIDWTLADNSVATLDAADIVGVAESLGANISAAHEWARGLRTQILAAQSVEAIDALVAAL